MTSGLSFKKVYAYNQDFFTCSENCIGLAISAFDDPYNHTLILL